MHSSHTKQDQQYFAGSDNIDIWFGELKSIMHNFDLAWKHYIKNTGAEEVFDEKFFYTGMKIQKTLPTEGYHVWHIEHGATHIKMLTVLLFVLFI